MKGKLLALLTLILPLCAACGQGEAGREGDYLLYFVASQGGHGPALDTEPYSGTAEPDPESLLTALLAGPSREGLVSPFPRGVTLQRWEWDQDQADNLQVWLSEQYSGLADISLTMADYCVALTLGQLEGVESVEIISEGHTANYRSHQRLRPEEAVLADQGDRSGK